MRPDPVERPQPGEPGAPMKSQDEDSTNSVYAPYNNPGEAAQLDLIASLEEGRRRRDRGAAAAELNTYTPHKQLILDTIEELAREGVEFTSDDVIDRVGHHPIGGTGSLGALFQSAAKRGIIEAVGFARSRRSERNGGWNRTWIGTGGGA